MNRGFNENEISDFLVHIIGQNTKFNQQKILESVYLLQIDKQLKKIIPTTLCDHVHPYKYSSGKLYLSTDHGIYAQQLQLYSDKILEDLRKIVSPDIKKINIQVSHIYYQKHKTDDIMSQDEKLTIKSKQSHQNSDLIDQLITAIKKLT
ncbi:MAG: DUF721 domain-containing protein [Spirochaetia bacterium]|nr:DUF721 domain-containing protein [Spirochaetia bacterium]